MHLCEKTLHTCMMVVYVVVSHVVFLLILFAAVGNTIILKCTVRCIGGLRLKDTDTWSDSFVSCRLFIIWSSVFGWKTRCILN